MDEEQPEKTQQEKKSFLFMSLIFPLICLSHNLKLSMFLNMTHLMFLIECFFNCSTHFFQTRHQTRDRSGRHGTVRYGMPATLTIRVTSSTLYLPPNTISSFYPDLERRTDGHSSMNYTLQTQHSGRWWYTSRTQCNICCATNRPGPPHSTQLRRTGLRGYTKG